MSASDDKDLRLTSLQLAVLRVLWDRGEATVAEVHRAMSEERSLAATTVATLLKRLAARGIVKHRTEGRQFVYRALVDAETIGRTMTSELARDVYAGDAPGLFAHLLDETKVSADDLKEIKRLIRKAEKEQ